MSSSALIAFDDSIVRRVVASVDVVGNMNRRAVLAVATSTPAFSVITIESRSSSERKERYEYRCWTTTVTLYEILPSLRHAATPRIDRAIWPLTTHVDELGRLCVGEMALTPPRS